MNIKCSKKYYETFMNDLNVMHKVSTFLKWMNTYKINFSCIKTCIKEVIWIYDVFFLNTS